MIQMLRFVVIGFENASISVVCVQSEERHVDCCLHSVSGDAAVEISKARHLDWVSVASESELES
jgi:hypothetical protein